MAGAAAARESRYLTPASVDAIIWEQIGYLIGHAASNCGADCPDCRRFEQVKRHLLEPFD